MVAKADRPGRWLFSPFEGRAVLELAQTVEEDAGKLHAPLARGLGDRAIGGDDLVIGPPPIVSNVRFHSLLPG